MTNKNTREFTITQKLRWNDVIEIDGKYQKVGMLITSSPLKIWNEIHRRGSRKSLTRDSYAALKRIIKNEFPEEYELNERKKRLAQSKQKFREHKGRFMYLRRSDYKIKNS